MCDSGDIEKAKNMSTGLYVSCPRDLKSALYNSFHNGYHFMVTQITHPANARDPTSTKTARQLGRTDRVLKGTEWGRQIVAELTPTINVDSEIEHVQKRSLAILHQELGFAHHLGVPAVQIHLKQKINTNLAQIIYRRLTSWYTLSIWLTVPMVKTSPVQEDNEDTWSWWNTFRSACHYEKRLGLVLELPDAKNIPPNHEIDRWLGEPVKALIIPTSYFILNSHDKPVLSKVHQEVIHKFMSLDVQYIIKTNSTGDISLYNKYLTYLGRKLYVPTINETVYQGMDDFIQTPLHPLSENLDTYIYEVFEKDEIKYTTYQNAIYKAIEDLPPSIELPVVMVVGAGRGPLVQAVLNVSLILRRTVKLYVVEKNPYAINTLLDRVEHEWQGRVTLIQEDMRVFEPPEKVDIMISELLGSFGDNELSPECLDGAQKCLKRDSGISIPASYTSYVAPIQSTKIHNEILASRLMDKPMLSVFERPYVVHLVNYYKIDEPKDLFTFHHPNWALSCNERFKKLRFKASQDCLLTGFAGFFDTVLYEDVCLSTLPSTHTKNMASWFPIVFPLPEPVFVKSGCMIEVAFWRVESSTKVWYEWCLEAPVNSGILNPNGRSYSIRKIC